MKAADISPLRVTELRPKISGVKLGRIEAIRDGKVFVDYEGNPFGPLPARTGSALSDELLIQAQQDAKDVLLVFVNQNPALPVVLDVVGLQRTELSQKMAIATAHPSVNGEAVESSDAVAQQIPLPIAAGICVAHICSVDDGSVYIDYEGNEAGPVEVRSTILLRNSQDPVLALLVPGGQPIIIGQIFPSCLLSSEGVQTPDFILKAERVIIEATAELLLVAGSCKIHLDARGKAVTMADQVISRAREANKIQGGSVQIN